MELRQQRTRIQSCRSRTSRAARPGSSPPPRPRILTAPTPQTQTDASTSATSCCVHANSPEVCSIVRYTRRLKCVVTSAQVPGSSQGRGVRVSAESSFSDDATVSPFHAGIGESLFRDYRDVPAYTAQHHTKLSRVTFKGGAAGPPGSRCEHGVSLSLAYRQSC